MTFADVSTSGQTFPPKTEFFDNVVSPSNSIMVNGVTDGSTKSTECDTLLLKKDDEETVPNPSSNTVFVSGTIQTQTTTPMKAFTLQTSLGTPFVPSTAPVKENSFVQRGLSSTSPVDIYAREEDPLVPSKLSSIKPLPTSQIVYIKPFLKSKWPNLEKSENKVTSSSSLQNILVTPTQGQIEGGETRATTASRIIYITLLPYPTKPSSVLVSKVDA